MRTHALSLRYLPGRASEPAAGLAFRGNVTMLLVTFMAPLPPTVSSPLLSSLLLLLPSSREDFDACHLPSLIARN
ncbi:hypothetical protein ACLKA7_003927 [Drosophila subpalustris]